MASSCDDKLEKDVPDATNAAQTIESSSVKEVEVNIASWIVYKMYVNYRLYLG